MKMKEMIKTMVTNEQRWIKNGIFNLTHIIFRTIIVIYFLIGSSCKLLIARLMLSASNVESLTADLW